MRAKKDSVDYPELTPKENAEIWNIILDMQPLIMYKLDARYRGLPFDDLMSDSCLQLHLFLAKGYHKRPGATVQTTVEFAVRRAVLFYRSGTKAPVHIPKQNFYEESHRMETLAKHGNNVNKACEELGITHHFFTSNLKWKAASDGDGIEYWERGAHSRDMDIDTMKLIHYYPGEVEGNFIHNEPASIMMKTFYDLVVRADKAVKHPETNLSELTYIEVFLLATQYHLDFYRIAELNPVFYEHPYRLFQDVEWSNKEAAKYFGRDYKWICKMRKCAHDTLRYHTPK